MIHELAIEVISSIDFFFALKLLVYAYIETPSQLSGVLLTYGGVRTPSPFPPPSFLVPRHLFLSLLLLVDSFSFLRSWVV